MEGEKETGREGDIERKRRYGGRRRNLERLKDMERTERMTQRGPECSTAL